MSSVLIGAHYFSGWWINGSGSHFAGYTPLGQSTLNFFQEYPERTPLLGSMPLNEWSVAEELAAADSALDFFDVLYYDGGPDCGYNADPGLRWCTDATLAFMLNSTRVWGNTSRIQFFLTYSNDIDRHASGRGDLVGDKGKAKWEALTRTWVRAMQHRRYMRIGGRPVFKVLIPQVFVQVQCDGNATLASQRLEELRLAARAAGLNNPLVGGGWENPSRPNVRVPGSVAWEWTGTYNAAPPVCPHEPSWHCPKYNHTWWPNTTATGARVFPYAQCGDYQGEARTNHSHDSVPYLPNLIAGFDPRPWEEHSPSFAMPSEAEWVASLRQVKAQCQDASNRFGFPDASAAYGYQPAVNIYAWNEFGEGGIMAPTLGEGYMKLRAIARVFGRETQPEPDR